MSTPPIINTIDNLDAGTKNKIDPDACLNKKKNRWRRDRFHQAFSECFPHEWSVGYGGLITVSAGDAHILTVSTYSTDIGPRSSKFDIPLQSILIDN